MTMQQFVQRVRDTATAAGGGYIPYSQCLEPTATLIKMMPQTSDGICQALCAKWIAEHANERSLFTWLCVPGTVNVRQGMIANLMANFVESTADNPKSRLFNRTAKAKPREAVWVRQDMVTNRYLEQYGVIRRGSAASKMVGKHTFPSGDSVGRYLADMLTPSKWNGRDFYVLISILGSGGGHALCAFVGHTDMILFDPNFGEFYFESHGKFKDFMNNFWDTSGYKNSYNQFYLMDYGRRA